MKLLRTSVMLTALASTILALQKVEVRVSDEMVQAGNVDLFASTWQAIYAENGNQRAVTIDKTHPGQLQRCNQQLNTQINLRVYIEGAWGDTGGVNHNNRDALVQAAWKALNEISAKDAYNVYTGCCFTDPIQPSCSVPSKFVCNRDSCGCQGGQHAVCSTRTVGHKVPSHINAYIYDSKNNLLSDHLQITFSSASTEPSGGCGIAGTLTKEFAGFAFPGVLGTLFQKGIELGCGA
ncbi:ureidoglycolate lyase [Fusarium sp. NRRL 25303]|nr:ureidoglycolate lyase [Fusarium sp. NRRL 25303]